METSTLRPPIRRLLAGLHQCRFTAQASAGAMKVEIASIKSHQPDTPGSTGRSQPTRLPAGSRCCFAKKLFQALRRTFCFPACQPAARPGGAA
jgi:hypothetical protein